MTITKRHVLYAVLAVIALSAVCTAVLNIILTSSNEKKAQPTVQTTGIKYSDKSVVHLYFSDKTHSFLTAEERSLFHSENSGEFAKIIIEALIDGPSKELMRTIPAETKIRALYVTRDGTAYVDMSNTVTDAHPGGIKSELFTIYSIVNSLILNIPEIDAVKILVGGREAMTLAGHIDLGFPFKANMLLIR
jgi:spore germination protein GerM